MMGERTVMQEALFYEFSLERHVPAGHSAGPTSPTIAMPTPMSVLPASCCGSDRRPIERRVRWSMMTA